MVPSTRLEELRQEDCCKFKDSLNLTDTLSSTKTLSKQKGGYCLPSDLGQCSLWSPPPGAPAWL